MDSSTSQVIELNVGGGAFTTTLSTLSLSPVLSSMFSGNHFSPGMLDSQGRYFIDRNGDAFHIILEFMRTGRIIRSSRVTDEQIHAEFDYFGFEYPQKSEKDNINPVVLAPKKSSLQLQFDGSIIPVWIKHVLIPFTVSNKKVPFYTEKNGLGKYFFNLRGKLGNYIVDSDSFYRIQESKEGYLAFNAHNIDFSRYVMDIIKEFLLRSDEAKDIFRCSLLEVGGFSHASFKLYTEQLNGIDIHSICITAFNLPSS